MRRLYLGEVLNRDKVEYGSNNMILSPVGSGKTYFIYNELCKKYASLKLMLVSTTSLKESLMKEDASFTTEDLRKRRVELGISDEDVYVMTYTEFGKRTLWDIHDEFLSQFKVIFADEIHSLFDYYSYGRSNRDSLALAIIKLFKKSEDRDVYYFTATTEKIDKFTEVNGDSIFADVTKIDYLKEETIVRHNDAIVKTFINVDEILDIIDSLKDFKRMGYKGVIYSDRISGMKKIENMLRKKGYRVRSTWSVNNKKTKMSEEELELQRHLIETGEIPEDLDFIIINGSMREGWNLKDKSVQLVILNTKSETDMIQARGRVRSDIMMVAIRVDGTTPLEVKAEKRIENNIDVITELLNKEMFTEDKENLSKYLGIVRDNGTVMKWGAISKTLVSMGYKIEDKVKRDNGKVVRYSVISK